MQSTIGCRINAEIHVRGPKWAYQHSTPLYGMAIHQKKWRKEIKLAMPRIVLGHLLWLSPSLE